MTKSSGTRRLQIQASGVTAIAAGSYHSLFIKTDGSLWGMGRNDSGQLGTGDTNEQIAPIQIQGSGVTAMAAGGSCTFFVKIDGSLWGIGDNYYGQLGTGRHG